MMIPNRVDRWLLVCGCIVACVGCGVALGGADAQLGSPEPLETTLTVDGAMRLALENNPELASVRQQHGIAAAGVVIARTYPFNPIWEGKVRATNGPVSAGITNRVSNEHKFLMDVEIHGQRGYRRQGANAALARTDWEIAAQEVTVAIQVARAFNTVLYRQEKLRLIRATIHLNEVAAEQVRKLLEGKLRPADLIVSRAEIDDARSQEGQARTALVAAENDLRRLLGVVDSVRELQGKLDTPPAPMELSPLVQAALERHPHLRARQAAVEEAEAKLRLEIANRHGNPNIGPAYEYDPTRINLIGAQVTLPLPVFNRHQGEIQQRQAERIKAQLDLRQAEIQLRQDVASALARVESARAWVQSYESQVLPNLRAGLDAMERLFQNDQTVDVLKIVDVRRKLLKARDNNLDALWEANQAQADLAAAVGDPSLAAPLVHSPEQPEMLPPVQP
jgi:cobalt-zinc-cadmium efflux system outer membrane protein